MDKRKRTNNDQQNTTQKTKDRAPRTPLNNGSELMCSGRKSTFIKQLYNRFTL